MNDNNANVDFYGVIGIANYKLGNYKEAVNELSKGISLKETDKFYYFRGLSNYKLKHFVQSCNDFTKALELNFDIESQTEYQIPKIIKNLMKIKDNKTAPIGLSQIKKG